MSALRYLPIAIIAASFSSQVHADNPKSQTVAQGPRQAVVSVPCLQSDITSLTPEADFSVFMSPSCPDPVRNNALRKLWPLLPPADTPTESNFTN
jgi:hypothetical protein